MSKVPKNWAQTTVKELAGTSGIFVDGDWVESLTALVEFPDGQLDIVHWGQVMAGDDAILATCRTPDPAEAPAAPAPAVTAAQ